MANFKQIIAMCLDGASYAQITHALGCSRREVSRAKKVIADEALTPGRFRQLPPGWFDFFTHAETTATECGFDATVTAAAALLETNAQPTGPHLGIAARYSAPPPTQHSRATLTTYDQLLATTTTTSQHAEATAK